MVVLLIAGGIVWAALSKLGGFERIDNAFPEDGVRPEVSAPAEDEDDPALNILILGSDSRANTSTPILEDLGNRSDTIMVAHIPSDRSGVQIMSIMSDSMGRDPEAWSGLD
ncbi:MAG: hypothetical protein ACTH05_08170 [Yaniella sp.]